MKNLPLIISLFCFSSVFAQEGPKHRAFLYAGTNWAPGYNMSYSAEAGIWGMSSPTSFSATFDITPNYGDITYWFGAKAYFTAYSTDKICYMIYIAPKVDTRKTGLLEFGFNPNYTLADDWLLGVTLGNQVFEGSPLNIFGSLGVVYLFRSRKK